MGVFVPWWGLLLFLLWNVYGLVRTVQAHLRRRRGIQEARDNIMAAHRLLVQAETAKGGQAGLVTRARQFQLEANRQLRDCV